MRTFFQAAILLAGYAAIASSPALAATTWQGISQGVRNDDTGEEEFYTVRFTFDDSAARYITPLTAQNPDRTPYTRSLFENVTSFSVTGVSGSVGFDTGTSYVSTLAPNLAQYGSVPFLVLAGTDGISAPGYQLQFAYTPAIAYGTTAMPTSLDIGAAGSDAGFNLLYFDYEGDPADEIIGQAVTILNFRFASGGFVPAAVSPVPEPASWAMMVAGFATAGVALRRRRPVPAMAI